jgi:hypothetical protein
MEADQNIQAESNRTARKQIQRNQSGCIVKARSARRFFPQEKTAPKIFNKEILASALF